jgi:hypothetical protein
LSSSIEPSGGHWTGDDQDKDVVAGMFSVSGILRTNSKAGKLTFICGDYKWFLAKYYGIFTFY